MICAASVYFMLLMQDLMLPVVISYVNAAIDTTAIRFKRRSPGCIFTLTACTLGLGPGCIFTLTAIAKWECSSYGKALALHARGTGSLNINIVFARIFVLTTLIEDENAMDNGVADTVRNHKRQHDDDKDDPSAGPNQGKKTKRRRIKESESSMKPSTTKETSKGKAPYKSSKIGKSATTKKQIEEPIIEVVMDDLKTNENEDVVNDADHPQDDVTPKTNKPSRDTWFKQPPRPPTPDPKWNKRQVVTGQPKQPWFNRMVSAAKDLITFDELMATRRPGHLTIAAEYFFNNDHEFLKSSDPEKNYTMSIMKTKEAWYEIAGIEYMVPKLWSPIKYGYDKDAKKGSSNEVKGVSCVVVKRADLRLYKFKEGYFIDLHLNDIEDMLLLAVQHKLFHLNGSDIVDFIVALRMFIRSLIIKRRVEDLQLGVESYQKKLNITEPQKTFPKIEFKELYTLSHKPPGVIYEDLNKQKRVKRANELYKFLDGTLKTVRDELHH
ncbi:hypothetical protein Tco_0490880 [Tanacetum coccineum]